MSPCLLLACVAAAAASADAAVAEKTSRVERVADGVWMVRDDLGAWGGSSMGMTHQRGPDYQALKVLDLGDVAEADWQSATPTVLSRRGPHRVPRPWCSPLTVRRR